MNLLYIASCWRRDVKMTNWLVSFLFLISLNVETLTTSFSLAHFLDWKRFSKSRLKPDSVHLEAGLSVFKEAVVHVCFNFFKPCVDKEIPEFLFRKVVYSRAIVFHIEVIFQLSAFLPREVQLGEVIPTVISEVQHTSRLHPISDFLSNHSVIFRRDCTQHED